MKKLFKNKIFITLLVLVVMLCALFVPFIKIPQENIFVYTEDDESDRILIYNSNTYRSFNWHDIDGNWYGFDENSYDFDENIQLNLHPYYYSYDYIPQKFERIFPENKVSVFNYFVALRYYSAGDSLILVHCPGVGVIPLAENFIYSNEIFKLPDFETNKISRIDIVRFDEYFNSNGELQSFRSDFLKYVYDKEKGRVVLAQITNKNEIDDFVEEINVNGSVDKFADKVAQKDGIEDEFYFRVVFKDSKTPFYLSIYTQKIIDKVYS